MSRFVSLEGAVSGEFGLRSPRVVAIGAQPEESLSRDADIAMVRFRDLDVSDLVDAAPGLVLSPLMGLDFDCVELAQLLHDAGFRGAYRAVTPPLPDTKLVVSEVRGLCPGLDFDVVVRSDNTHKSARVI